MIIAAVVIFTARLSEKLGKIHTLLSNSALFQMH